MMQEALRLFRIPARSKGHRRQQQATIIFTLLWGTSIIFIIFTPFLIASVQALVLLNTAASLMAAVVTLSLCSRADTQQNYPFCFGLYRLSVVVRLGSTVFLVFGCVTTVVESLHRGIHAHHSSPLFLLSLGGVQLLSQIVFCRDVRLTDRVTGHHGMAGVQSEDILQMLYAAACRERCAGRDGSSFEEFHCPSSVSGHGRSPMAHGSPSGVQRTVHNSSATMVVYLLCPITCVVASVVMLVTDSAAPDVIGALFLAIYYSYVGYQNGRDMLDLLMNKSVTDTRRLHKLERCLRNIKVLDGVLLVQSTVWWNINASESMLLIRLRLMSGSDACAVSHAVRKQLFELATYVYVECFPASSANGLGDSAPSSWGTPLTGAHGHSHGVHGHSHSHHRHNHKSDQSHDHGNSHDNGHNVDGRCGHDHGHSHSDLFVASGEVTLSTRRHSNEFGAIRGDGRPGPMAAALPSGAQRFPGVMSYRAHAGGEPASMEFPTPPGTTSGGRDPLAERQRFLRDVPPIDNATAAQPSPSTGFSYVSSNPYGVGTMSPESCFGQPVHRDAAVRAADFTSSLALPSRLPDMPPSVVMPLRDQGARIGGEVRRSTNPSVMHDFM
ncbi:conserved hypothetical protein [Leishmania braziliensis MHOM/BR/75/M2904]|uniref:Cation efflux protein transmembrane domain-containing protein n=2 Tax=Leishmania braziliensis TaxID=5660 RepID=A4HKH5_LEIBR|nr:conserved hypothetical protein [Leishmania braziliensis MHOM/BR/75/M2904]CAJ2478651.1 unnamed protein product [Leishmania braziliensis]CAM43000.2 conserved hypothetical protein [Leishmania braziliensis MHOM/BR/75/M2904]SYZ68704.1 Cation_efflux_family [Leishmania braziliensis MHOM/BR/75/M2904]